MKHIFITILFWLSAVFLFGQGRTSIGVDVGLPMGSGTNGVGAGLGGWVRFEKGIGRKITWLASIAYLHFPGSFGSSSLPPIPGPSGYPPTTAGANVEGNSSFVPILAGAKYYPLGNFNGFYFGADLGVTVISFKGTLSSTGYSEPISEKQNQPTVVPTIGYHTKKMDFGFRYNLIESASYYGARIGVVLD